MYLVSLGIGGPYPRFYSDTTWMSCLRLGPTAAAPPGLGRGPLVNPAGHRRTSRRRRCQWPLNIQMRSIPGHNKERGREGGKEGRNGGQPSDPPCGGRGPYSNLTRQLKPACRMPLLAIRGKVSKAMNDEYEKRLGRRVALPAWWPSRSLLRFIGSRWNLWRKLKMCLKSPGTPLKASSAHICPRTFETHFTTGDW